MFGSSIIDIAIGMVFVYLLLSLICSAGNEIFERLMKNRAQDLENGIKEMLKNPDLVKQLYEHPLVNSLFFDNYASGAKNLPSYIPSRNFAMALMDLIGPGAAKAATAAESASAEAAMAELRAALKANTTLPDGVKKALTTFADASPTPAKVRENIENWFDSSMDRVSGFYKRRSQKIILILGLLVTIALNVDSIVIMRVLSTDRTMRDSLVAAAGEYAKSNPTPPVNPAANTSSSTSPGGASSESKPAANSNSNQTAANNTNGSAAKNANSSPRASTANANAANVNAPPASPSPGAPIVSVKPIPMAAGSTCNTPECRVKENLNQIEQLGLPIGWNRQIRNPPDPRSIYVPWGQWLMRVIGWLITALALSLGAPFWFDVLNKFMVVRSTVKPKEKSQDEPPKG
ncbi:MAG TPA: hypothetical protein VE961_19745 [Pyrinomonadaceae bacterium]|nr:hypothetical protein [Pyrinomonadaceae bacterium]